MKVQSNPSLIDIIRTHLEFSDRSYIVYATSEHQIPLYEKSKKIVYCLIEGRINVHRKVDNVLIFSMTAPAIIGLFSLGENDIYHHFVTATNVKLIAIEEGYFSETIEANNLWKNIFLLAADYARYFFVRDEKFNSKDVYSIIKNNLELLWQYPEEERMQISIFKFILSRSQISRSSLNKILKDLIEGGYIDINRGRLLSMKELPRRY